MLLYVAYHLALEFWSQLSFVNKYTWRILTTEDTTITSNCKKENFLKMRRLRKINWKEKSREVI